MGKPGQIPALDDRRTHLHPDRARLAGPAGSAHPGENHPVLLAQIARDAGAHAGGVAPCLAFGRPRTAPITPITPGSPPWEIPLARATHLFLYGLNFALSVSGWLLNSAAGIPFKILWILPLPAIAPVSLRLERLFEWVYLALFSALGALLIAHIGSLTLRLTLILHGSSHPFLVTAHLWRSPARLRVSGTFAIKQPVFGIKPYSILLGALRVKNRLVIRYHWVFNRWFLQHKNQDGFGAPRRSRKPTAGVETANRNVR